MSTIEFLSLCNIKEDDKIIRTFEKGKIVEDRIENEKCVAFIMKGEIDSYIVSADGKETLLSVLKEGSILGIGNLFIEDELKTLLICKKECEAIFIRKTVFKKILSSSPYLMDEYSKLMNTKIQFLLRRIEQLSISRSRIKVAEYLMDDDRITYKSKEELASILGISRAALYREIAYFEKENCIRFENRKLLVTDREKIETLCAVL